MQKILAATAAMTIAVMLTSCAMPPPASTPAPAPQTPAAPPPATTVIPSPDLDQMDIETATALIKTKLRANSEYLFCDQRGYLDCYRISHAQCLSEVAAVKNSCIDKADIKFPAIQTKPELESYSGDVSACLAIQHALLHRERMQELSSCIKAIKFDPQQRDQSLFK
ncbi:MAG: hypothetical protein ABW049_13015 [Spongiibacteraceae bacterium]